MKPQNRAAIRRVIIDGEPLARLPEQIAALIARGQHDAAFAVCINAHKSAESLKAAIHSLQFQINAERKSKATPRDLELSKRVTEITRSIDGLVLRCRIEKQTGRAVSGRTLKQWLKGTNPPEPDERRALDQIWGSLS